MPHGLERRYRFGHLHFITCSCYRRLPLLGLAESRSQFVKVLGEVRTKIRSALVGYVVMPEHVHVLIGEPPQGTPSDVMRELKHRVASFRFACSDRRVTRAEPFASARLLADAFL